MDNNVNLYDANNDEKLILLRNNCKDKCFKFNNTLPSDKESQKKVLSEIFGKNFENTVITAPFYCDYGTNIVLGKNFYANHNLVILDCAKVTIGDNVFVGPNCTITCAGHPIDYKIRNKGLEYALPINIGDNVWIGANVCILPGVSIGNNVVIGAGSVVNRDIPSNTIAVGVPCKAIKTIWSYTIFNIVKDWHIILFQLLWNQRYSYEKIY